MRKITNHKLQITNIFPFGNWKLEIGNWSERD